MKLFSNIFLADKKAKFIDFKGVNLIPLQLLNTGNLKVEIYDKLNKKNMAKASEVSNSGEVNLINVENLSKFNLVLHDGEILKGAKQNRCISKTVIVKPNSNLDVEVFCVEQGRWNDSSRFFRNSNCKISPKMMSMKNSNYDKNSCEDVQNMIWN